MKTILLAITLLLFATTGFSQTGVMDNFDDNLLDPGWKFNLSCASCYTGTESNSELLITTISAGPTYENFEFEFAPINILANPIVTVNVKNTVAFDLRIDLVDINDRATNALPNVKAVTINASYVQYVFDFTGRFNQNTPSAATVDPTQIIKAVFFVNPGGAAFSNSIFFNNLIIGTPPSPVAGYTASSTAVCTGSPVTFTNTSGNFISTYSWNFGADASPANATSYGPHNVSWSTSGTKTVSLTVTGPGGTDVYSSDIVVTAAPAAAGAITGPASVCEENTSAYSITAVPGATGYSWSLPPGASISSGNNTNNVSISFGSSSGTISVTPGNTCGNGASSSLPLTVNPSLASSVSITASSSTICSGTSVTFTATPVNGGTSPVYQWKVNNIDAGTNSTQFSSSTLADGDEVTVLMTSNAACAAGSPSISNVITMDVSSGGSPSVSISTVNSTTICSGETVIFAADPVNGGNSPAYVWKQNGSVIAGEVTDTLIIFLINDDDVFTCEMTASGCASGTAVSNPIVIDVIPRVLVNVFIATDEDTVCTGSTIDFTAIPVNGGALPSYQWKVNGVNAGSDSPFFSSSTLTHRDTISLEMISSSTQNCLINNPAETEMIISIVSSMPSSVKINASATSICSGSDVTFTATPLSNGGASPSYQWKVNGTGQGSNNAVFNYHPDNNDIVTCEMTSGISCALPSTSNPVQITSTTSLTPSVTISAPSSTICADGSLTFTANAMNGGSAPEYKWEINSIDQAAALATFTPAALNDGDVVTCIVTSDLSCASTPSATSNPIAVTVNPMVTPSVSISSSATSICSGTEVTVTATPVNGGTNPAYLWKRNNLSTGVNGPVFISSDLTDTDQITCEMTSDHSCSATGSPVVSNTVLMDVTAVSPASVSIAPDISPICPGAAVTFTASPVNGGAAPEYQWTLNSSPVGTNSSSYSHSGLSEGDVISCSMLSNASCVSGSPALSNSITVNPSTIASISISAGENPVCNGSEIDFTSIVSGEGTMPVYEWRKNSIPIPGADGPTYTAASLADNDIISCRLTSNAACVALSPVTSNEVTISVTTPLTTDVNIATASSSICAGETVTFTATPVNGGSSPVYVWKVNGQTVGTNSSAYSSSSLLNNATVSCTMTSSETCTTGPAVSNTITMAVSNPPSIAVAGFDQYITASNYSLSASAPSSGSGIWTTAGGASILNPTSPGSAVENLSSGPNSFTWTVSNGPCPVSADEVIIYVGNAPLTQSISGPLNVSENASGITYSVTDNGSSYYWTVVGASLISGQGTNSITVDFATDNASIYLTEFNEFGNYSTDIAVLVTGPTSIRSSNMAMLYTVFPNPFSEEVSLTLHSPVSNTLSLKVINMQGETVYESNRFSSNETILLGKDMVPGMYAVQVISDKGGQVIKITKE